MSRLQQDCVATVLVELQSSISREEVLQAQQEDADVQRIMKHVHENDWPTPSENQVMAQFNKIGDDLFIDEGLLYRQVHDECCQVILPPALHEKMLHLFHDSAEGGHLGATRVFQKLAEVFYWPSMRKIVSKFIAGCLQCEKFKSSEGQHKSLAAVN